MFFSNGFRISIFKRGNIRFRNGFGQNASLRVIKHFLPKTLNNYSCIIIYWLNKTKDLFHVDFPINLFFSKPNSSIFQLNWYFLPFRCTSLKWICLSNLFHFFQLNWFCVWNCLWIHYIIQLNLPSASFSLSLASTTTSFSNLKLI